MATATKKSSKIITKREIKQYVRVNNLYHQLKGEREKLNKTLKDELVAGATCSTEAPFLLELQYQDRPKYTEKQLFDMATEFLPAEVCEYVRTKYRMYAEVKVNQPWSIVVKSNPEWSGK